LLKRKGVAFEEINLDGRDDELQALRERTGLRTVPQIFIGEEMVGGFTELAALDSSGELDQKLKA
jgi:glutaredoxin 3